VWAAIIVAIKVEVSYGELVDKVSILEIKAARASDPGQRRNIERELAALDSARRRIPDRAGVIGRVFDALKAVNERLWAVEDRLRDCERRRDFGAEFIELARSVYRLNDRRAALKREINAALGSPLVEEKLHPDY
jgi:hypothetical protein